MLCRVIFWSPKFLTVDLLVNSICRGVYIVPDLHDLRVWHGAIFVRRGYYANGFFKFRVELSRNYGDKVLLLRLVKHLDNCLDRQYFDANSLLVL